MKNLLLSILLLSAVALHAQHPITEGQKQINAGLGLSSWGLPVYVGLDYGLSRDFTIGADFSLRTFHKDYSGINYSHTIFGISGNGNYHFNRILNMPSRWDFYAGLNLGAYFWSYPSDYPGNRETHLGLGAQVGGRYYFNQHISANLELGGGVIGSGKIGLTFKL
ncbi:MAG: hypothetical protein CFE24_01815 [Flavobacterium sp. BFFFF2]|nr:MAG: hypothetical protein CFE24_01815 [Flavobacterium sp. BFFFF2]